MEYPYEHGEARAERDRARGPAPILLIAVVAGGDKKLRITIRPDRDLVQWFKAKAEAQGAAITRPC